MTALGYNQIINAINIDNFDTISGVVLLRARQTAHNIDNFPATAQPGDAGDHPRIGVQVFIARGAPYTGIAGCHVNYRISSRASDCDACSQPVIDAAIRCAVVIMIGNTFHGRRQLFRCCYLIIVDTVALNSIDINRAVEI